MNLPKIIQLFFVLVNKPQAKNVLAFLLVLIFLFLTTASAKRESLTFDEVVYVQEGKANILERKFLIDPYNPPLIRELAVLPLLLTSVSNDSLSQQFFPGRAIVIAISLLLLGGVYYFTCKYFNATAGVFAIFFLTFDPTFLSNSHYITPDVGLSAFVFFAFMMLFKFTNKPTASNAVFAGFFLGCALSSKIISLFYFSVGVIFILLYFKSKKVKLLARLGVWQVSMILFVAALVVWGTYFFTSKSILVPHDNPQRLSRKILEYSNEHKLPFISDTIRFLYNTPLPLGDYFGIVKNTILRFQYKRLDFFLGEQRNPSFFNIFIIWILKAPLPFFLILAFGIFSFIFQKKAKIETRNLHIFLLPLLSILLVSAMSKLTPLVRYLLPASPFLAIIVGKFTSDVSRKYTFFLVLFIFWQVFSVISSFPHFISYTNELVPEGKKPALLTDSNIDWGQGLISFQKDILQLQPKKIYFSYFGRDDASLYGFSSNIPWGSYKNDEICAFHEIEYPEHTGKSVIAISITNWHHCGYKGKPEFSFNKIFDISGDSILLFNSKKIN